MKNKKKLFEKAELEVIRFTALDVIATSADDNPSGTEDTEPSTPDFEV